MMPDQRYYSSGAGRFTTPDPFITTTALTNPSSGWNRYAYVENDPVNYGDPRGPFISTGPNLEWDYVLDDPIVLFYGFTLDTPMPWEAPLPGGGGGGGGGFIHVGNPSKTGPNEQIRTVLDWISNNIDADCSGWLNGISGAIGSLEGDPSDLDTVLIGHGAMDIGIGAFTGNNPGQTDLPPGYAITVNDAGAFFWEFVCGEKQRRSCKAALQGYAQCG